MIESLLMMTILALTPLTPQTAEPQPSLEPIVSEKVLNAPIEDVWKVFTTREGMMASGQVAEASEFELRIGETWRSSYSEGSNLDDGTVIETEILAFDPERTFAARTIRAPSDFPFPNAIFDTWYVLYLEPVGEEATRVTLRMFGFTESEESQQMRAFFEWGNQYELDNLAEYFGE